MTGLVNEKVNETALLLANAGELAAAVIRKVAGNDISTAINGSALTREMVHSLVFKGIEHVVTKRASGV